MKFADIGRNILVNTNRDYEQMSNKWVQTPVRLQFLHFNIGVSIFLSVFHGILSAQVSVDPGKTAIQLAQKLAGQGVTVTNPILTCPTQANGFFKTISSNLGLDSGILLTTGLAATQGSAIGVNGNSTLLASNDDSAPGDSSLLALARQTTYDACKLEFDVVPNGDTISIQYVFSSEEYINSVCGPYNDAFAFFISGTGISGVDNMALVPGTNIPVTINSINDGIPGRIGSINNCTAMGTGSPFTAYYVDNSRGASITHEGFTTVLKAIHAVTPCAKYHLKIVIADAGDPLYDSGVFLESASLQSGTYTVQAVQRPVNDTFAPICVKDCLPGKFHIKGSRISAVPQVIMYTTAGTAVSGIDYMSLPDSVTIPVMDTAVDVIINGLPTPVNGTKTLNLYLYSPGTCGAAGIVVDSASMYIYDTLSLIAFPADTLVCRGDSVMLNAVAENIYQFKWSPSTYLSADNVQQPVAHPSTNITYAVTASLPNTSCATRSASVTLSMKLTPYVTFLNPDTSVCYNTSFQLAPQIAYPGSFYTYQWTGPGGFTATIPNPVITAAKALNTGLYTLVVKNDTNTCGATASVAVAVDIPDTPVVISPAIFCLNTAPESLEAHGQQLTWYSAGTDSALPGTPVISTDAIANYQYYVTQTLGNCTSPQAPVLVEVMKCCDGNIFIPNAFTPNGDGRNDHFNVRPDYGYIIKDFTIYNRWGQVVCHNNLGTWDGNFEHIPADNGTYFYKIAFSCILGGTVEKVGDVELIR